MISFFVVLERKAGIRQDEKNRQAGSIGKGRADRGACGVKSESIAILQG